MNKDEFVQLMDKSWDVLRKQLIEAFPEPAPSLRTSPRPPGPSPRNSPGQAISSKDLQVVQHLSPSSQSSPSDVVDNVVSEVDEELVSSTASGVFRSGLKDLDPRHALAISQRLRVRLGIVSTRRLVTGSSLHEAVLSLGLTRYTVQDMNDLVTAIAVYVGLHFKDDTSASFSKASFQDDMDIESQPIWRWPDTHNGESPTPSVIPHDGSTVPNVVPAKALMEVFLAKECSVHKRIFSTARLFNQYKAMREILMAGDTNRLVAELTFVRLNDLAAPPEPMHPLMYLEPFVAVLILANGIMIGFQTDPLYQDWEGWVYLELAFAIVLLLEIFLRINLLRCRTYWCGPERYWNWFDIFLTMTSAVDVVIQLGAQQMSDIAGTSLLRFTRLIRLARIVKVFRLKIMRDLRLMVKGWIAGIRTLILAFTLLFTVLYVLSGFATMTIGSYQSTADIGLQPYFSNIPKTMFTAFRCFTGECTNQAGFPMTHLLAETHGNLFILSYVASYMLVTMGIFNVILAVYVDITMKAAKDNDTNAEQYARESVRIAQCARELVKIFAAAFRRFNETDETHGKRTSMGFDAVPAAFTDNDVHDEIQITKELFLIMIQDRGVQKLMNELDLPPDRANLFEVIDADGNGTLHIAELVHGMLKIRGDVTKSDTVATLLATKSLQQLTTRMKAEWRIDFDNLLYRIGSLQDEVQELRLIRQGPGPAPDVAGPEPELHDQPVCFRPVFPTSLLTVPVPAKPTDVQEESDDSELGFLPPSLSR